jgi:outer membrane protein assembly factor BamB
MKEQINPRTKAHLLWSVLILLSLLGVCVIPRAAGQRHAAAPSSTAWQAVANVSVDLSRTAGTSDGRRPYRIAGYSFSLPDSSDSVVQGHLHAAPGLDATRMVVQRVWDHDVPAWSGIPATQTNVSGHGIALDRLCALWGRTPFGPTQDWTNLGGNAHRNGMSSAAGPSASELVWSNTNYPSIIAWHPVTLGERVFAIRESGFPGVMANDKLVAYDIATGQELWNIVVPYHGNPNQEWIAYVAGTHDGKVYAARGGSERTTPIYAFDAATGALVWTSMFETGAGPYDGIVFASNGDLIVGDFASIARINSTDGSTVWATPRSCPVSGSCGAALGEGAAYIHEQTSNGPAVVRFNLATGERQYATNGLGGLTAQNSPFVGPDGTVYFARSQNNPNTDFLYAFDDTGSALVERWHVPMRWTTFHEHGIGPDGSIYTFLPGNEFVRLSPTDGSVINSAGVLQPVDTNLTPLTAVDADGKVYVSNGWASDPVTNGRVWAFSPDLQTLLFTLVLYRQNIGGPSLAADGTLIVADLRGVFAYREVLTPTPTPTGTPTATATASSTATPTPTSTSTPRASPSPRVRPTPAPRP